MVLRFSQVPVVTTAIINVKLLDSYTGTKARAKSKIVRRNCLAIFIDDNQTKRTLTQCRKIINKLSRKNFAYNCEISLIINFSFMYRNKEDVLSSEMYHTASGGWLVCRSSLVIRCDVSHVQHNFTHLALLDRFWKVAHIY